VQYVQCLLRRKKGAEPELRGEAQQAAVRVHRCSIAQLHRPASYEQRRDLHAQVSFEGGEFLRGDGERARQGKHATDDEGDDRRVGNGRHAG